MPNVPLDTLEGSVSRQLKHTDRREWHISRRAVVAKARQFVRTYVAKENVPITICLMFYIRIISRQDRFPYYAKMTCSVIIPDNQFGGIKGYYLPVCRCDISHT